MEEFLSLLQDYGLLSSEAHTTNAVSDLPALLQVEDIADTLWLAAKMGEAYEDITAEAESETAGETSSMEIVEDISSAKPVGEFAAVSIPEPVQATAISAEMPEQGLPIQVQAAPALPDARQMGRALRPLMRKVPSPTRLELDEIATVNCIADYDIWSPVLRPAPERWFDLELVIEASKFSFIWQETLAEFQHLLETQGAFRYVRTWLVEGADAGQPRLVAKKKRADSNQIQPTRSPKELVDVSGRRLVLLVSDCRSALWQQGKIHDWLALWSRHGPAAIVQLLPERLWSQSELDVGFSVQVEALTAGVANHHLRVKELPTRTRIAPIDALTFPVVTLTASALKQWALVVAAAGRQRAPARMFDMSWVKDVDRDRVASVIHPKLPEARVELFRATASPIARQLAGLMAAVPVDLSVVHLIQQVLLPQLMPVHIAEVYTSGLLEEVSPQTSHSQSSEVASFPSTVRYRFVEGVRGLLNESMPLDQTLGVIEALSQRIARTLGFEIKSFTALLSPRSTWSQAEREAILPFAQVATEVLHRLGGDYAELAELVEQDARNRTDWFNPDEGRNAKVQFPDLEALSFSYGTLFDAETDSDDFAAAADNAFPAFKTANFKVATIVLGEDSLDKEILNGEKRDEVSEPTAATVDLTKGVAPDLRRGVALIEDKSIGEQTNELPARLASEQAKAMELVSSALNNNGWVFEVEGEQADFFQVAVGRQGEYEISMGAVLKNLRPLIMIDAPNAAEAVVERLVHLAKYQAVQALENTDAESTVDFKVDLMQQPGWESGDPYELEPFADPDNIEIVTGEFAFLRIVNLSQRILYISGLDLEPTWAISKIDYRGSFDGINPREEQIIPLQFSLPEGEEQRALYTRAKEVIKIFAVGESADFSCLELPALDSIQVKSRSIRADSLRDLSEATELAQFPFDKVVAPSRRGMKGGGGRGGIAGAKFSRTWTTRQIQLTLTQ